MIVLDTNVLSTLMAANPEPAVVAWLDSRPADAFWITSITLFEARAGIRALPGGRRRDALAHALETIVGEDLGGRVLDFDATAADAASGLYAHRRRSGRTVDLRDTMIAGIVTARRATLATRNVRHFADLDVPVVDPWSGARRRT